MKKRTIKTQLILSFLVISTLLIGSFSIIAVELTNTHFNAYVDERHEEELSQYLDSLYFSWENNDQSWNSEELHILSEQALGNNLYFTLNDANGKIIWQLDQEERRIADQVLQEEAQALTTTTQQGDSTSILQTSENLLDNDTLIGTVDFFYIGPHAYTEHDMLFLSAMKESLFYIALGALIISLIFASWVAKKFSLPLVHVSEFTHQLTTGNYSSQLEQETAILEINSLIDSLNNLNDQLENQKELRERLTSDVSHELRTPLTTLKGNIEAMIDGVWEITSERLQACYNEIDRLTRLIKQIETLNQLDSHHDIPKKSYFDFYQLSQDVINNFASRIEEKQHTVTIEGEKVTVFADKDKLNQVLTNLLNNAIKFTPSKGEISFHINKKDKEVQLSIEDNGIGIKEEDCLHIFDRFYMVDPSRNKVNGGQGIGLATVKSILESHNGRVEVKSQYGSGSTFIIKLPL